jgi:hypothetical protein
VCAGRRSGKTELAKRHLIRSLKNEKPWDDPRYFFGGPTYDQAKKIAWEDLQKLTPRSWVKKTYQSDMCIRTIFGSEVWVLGLDKPERMEGPPWDGGIIDESSDQRPGTFTKVVYPALMDRRGWCWRIGVPKRYGPSGPEFRECCENANTADEWDYFHWISADILPKSVIDHARTTLDKETLDEQLNARWISAAGGIFYAFDKDYNIRPCEYQRNNTILVGSDFNVDPMAWVLVHRIGNRLEVFDELFIRNANTPLALNMLYEKYKTHQGGFEFYGDATSRARKTAATSSDYQHIMEHEGFKKLGRTLHYLMSNPHPPDRFAATNSLLKSASDERRLFIDTRCEQLIHDLEARTYKPGTRVADDTGDIGHITDGLGYLVYKIFPMRIMIEDTTSEVGVSNG